MDGSPLKLGDVHTVTIQRAEMRASGLSLETLAQQAFDYHAWNCLGLRFGPITVGAFNDDGAAQASAEVVEA